MHVAFVQFNGITALDLIGFYDTVMRLPRFSAVQLDGDLCAISPEACDQYGLRLTSQKVMPNLSAYDLVFIPGGLSAQKVADDPQFVAWLQTARTDAYKVSVCTGALLLGAAGFLAGRRATTHPGAYAELTPYCTRVVPSRIVRDGNVITAGGVSASIDLGLYVVELLTDVATVQRVQRSLDYPYYRPGLVDSDYPRA